MHVVEKMGDDGEMYLEEICHETANDRPDIVSRCFEQMKKKLMQLLHDDGVMGEVIGHCHTYEWQKRSLPHVHTLEILANAWRIKTGEDVDAVICAEIPNPNTHPKLHKLVTTLMMHGPCGVDNPAAACCQNPKKMCRFGFPKQYSEISVIGENGYAMPKRSRPGDEKWEQIIKIAPDGKICKLDNRHVVSYNPWLLLTMQCHMNIEITHHIACVRYLYKYIFKGSDRVLMHFKKDTSGKMVEETVHDEVDEYLNCRYLCANEGVAMINSYRMHEQFPPSMNLPLHLPHVQYVNF
jgi:hypothetical protein